MGQEELAAAEAMVREARERHTLIKKRLTHLQSGAASTEELRNLLAEIDQLSATLWRAGERPELSPNEEKALQWLRST